MKDPGINERHTVPPPVGLAVALDGHCAVLRASCSSKRESPSPQSTARAQRVQKIYADSKEPKSFRSDNTLMQGGFGVFEDEVRTHLLGLDRKLETQFLELDRKLDLIALQVNGGFDNINVNLSKRFVSTSKTSVAVPEKSFNRQTSPESTTPSRVGGIDEAEHKGVMAIRKAPSPTEVGLSSNGDHTARSGQRRRFSLASGGSMSSIGLSSWDLDFIRRSRPNRWKQFVWNVLEDPDSGCVARWFPRVWSLLIVATSLLSLMHTVKSFPIQGIALVSLQLAVDIVFFLEILLRFMICRSAWIFISNLHNVIDAIAALPLIVRIYILAADPDLTDPESVAGTMLICVVPMIRLMKVMRHVRQFYLFIRLLDETREALSVLLFLLLVIVISFSTLIFLVEPHDNVGTLPKAMYLIIVTISTVGYGDVTPATTAGTVAVSAIIPCSVLYMAMPIGIVGNAFTRIWSDRDRILLTIKTRERLKEWGYSAADTTMLLRHFDSNRNGELNLHEFRQMIAEMHLSIKDDRVVAMFDSFDKDGSGEIDPKEFTRMLFPSTFYELLDREERAKELAASASPPPDPAPQPLKKPSKGLPGLPGIRSRSKEQRKVNDVDIAIISEAAPHQSGVSQNGDDCPPNPSKWRMTAAA